MCNGDFMNKGSVLVVTLVVVVFLFMSLTLIISIYNQIINNYSSQQKRLLVSNVARSGAYVLADYYVKNPDKVPAQILSDLNATLPEFSGQIKYTIIPATRDLTIKYTASLESFEDTYSLRLVKSGSLYLGAALISKNTLEIENNGKIDGDVEVLNGDLILNNNVQIVGNVYVKGKIVSAKGGGGSRPIIRKNAYAGGSIDEDVNVYGTKYPNQNPVPFPSQAMNQSFPLPNPPPEKNQPVKSIPSDSVVRQSGNYGDITIQNKNKIVFDTSNGDLSIYAKNIYFDNQGTIEVTGSGKVKIYFENNVGPLGNANNQVTIDIKNGSQILLYSAGSGTMSFKNGLEVKVEENTNGALFIYAPKVTLNVQNNFVLKGALITDNLTGGNNLNLSFISPGDNLFPIDLEPLTYRYGGWSK